MSRSSRTKLGLFRKRAFTPLQITTTNMASASKKRKRDTEHADEVTLHVSAGEDTAGPVLGESSEC